MALLLQTIPEIRREENLRGIGLIAELLNSRRYRSLRCKVTAGLKHLARTQTMLLNLARKMEKIFRENREMRETIRKLEGTHLDIKEEQ